MRWKQMYAMSRPDCLDLGLSYATTGSTVMVVAASPDSMMDYVDRYIDYIPGHRIVSVLCDADSLVYFGDMMYLYKIDESQCILKGIAISQWSTV